jgi:hypothetical protein
VNVFVDYANGRAVAKRPEVVIARRIVGGIEEEVLCPRPLSFIGDLKPLLEDFCICPTACNVKLTMSVTFLFVHQFHVFLVSAHPHLFV